MCSLKGHVYNNIIILPKKDFEGFAEENFFSGAPIYFKVVFSRGVKGPGIIHPRNLITGCTR